MSRVGWLGSVGWLRSIGLGLRVDGGALVGHLGHVAVVVVRRVLKKVGSENIFLNIKIFLENTEMFFETTHYFLETQIFLKT